MYYIKQVTRGSKWYCGVPSSGLKHLFFHLRGLSTEDAPNEYPRLRRDSRLAQHHAPFWEEIPICGQWLVTVGLISSHINM